MIERSTQDNNEEPHTSVVSQKFIYIFNAMALAEIKSPCVPLFQRGRCLREGVNPSLPKRGRGDLRAHCKWNHLENIVESYVKNC
jgi:hypothetical protein